MGTMMGKSLGMARESRGGLLLGTGHLDGPEARLGNGQGVHDLEVRVPEVQFLQDPIATFRGDIHHAVGREVEGIGTGESGQESARVRAEESAVDLQ
ncbi:hypothetical protein CEP54_006151 [Fusarium duplospermum]|uniref:Uncharacterized protein n=1 Tax=Fusarium duplospermum TaxID=1325734 RepID=A0A428Q8L6_9HYPO|nr:hypothetical protein CEP54_006151 [Fusarium duplospermum]